MGTYTNHKTIAAKNKRDLHIQKQLKNILHYIKSNKRDLGFKKARKVFSMLSDRDDAYVLKFLNRASAARLEIRTGEDLTGIFCDIEGTLFTKGVLNEAILKFLHDYAAEGKEITLWTDGSISVIRPLLDANKIMYKIYAKRDFAGAIVEMAVDDMDEHSFSAVTKIYARKFIRARDILFNE